MESFCCLADCESDGGGHTLTVDYGSYGSPIAEDKAAPFPNVESGCKIENLHVAGDIYTSKKYAGGIVGTQYGSVTIRNCHVSTVIHSLTGGDGTHGGIVGLNGDGNGSALTIEGCVFDGKLLTEGATATATCAGFVGYKNKNRSVTITNSLYAPATLNDGETEIATGATFARNWTMPADANCYYTRTLGDAQGRAAYVYTPAAESFVPQNVGAEGTAYNVSGITAYGSGLKYEGKFYFMKAAVSLADNADNSGNIINKQVADVTLQGRTLYKDGSWNTICLPFNVTISGSPLDGATARTVTAASISGTTLNLEFGNAVDELKAGTPYIIKWAKADNYVDDATHNIVNPVFEGVTISTDKHDYDTAEKNVTTDEHVRFVSTYKSTAFDSEDTSILFMGAANKLYYPTKGAGIGSCRAYFKIGDDEAALPARRLTSFSIDFGDDNATGIISVTVEARNNGGGWYTIDGRKLAGKPTQNGIYIRSTSGRLQGKNNGKRVVIK